MPQSGQTSGNKSGIAELRFVSSKEMKRFFIPSNHLSICYIVLVVERSFIMMKLIGALSGFVGKYLTYIVLLVVVWAYFMPGAFLWAVPHTVLLLGVIMFGMGMTLHASDFKLILQRPKEVLIGCVCHYTIMPLLAYGLVMAFHMPPELAVGMILLGSCPSGTASNVMGFLAKADVPLSVSITTASTLIAPIMMPFIMWALAGQWVEVSFFSMALTVMKVILAPLALGLLVHKFAGEKYIVPFSKILVLISAATVLIIVGGVIAINGAKILEIGGFMILMVVAHSVGGFIIGCIATRMLGLGKKQQHSVTLEVGMQNDALAISLVSVFFTPAVAIPAAVGAAAHQVLGSILAGIFARHMDAHEAKEKAKAAQLAEISAPAQH